MTRAAPPAPAPTPVPAPTPASAPPEPAPLVRGAPWFVLDERHIVLTDEVASTWFDAADLGFDPENVHPHGIWRAAKLAALPAAVRELLGTPLTLMTKDTAARCPAQVTKLWAASIAVFTESDGSPFFEAIQELNDPGREPTPAARSAKAWASGRRMLVAELSPPAEDAPSACADPLLAVPADKVPERLTNGPAPTAQAARALAKFRKSAFWELQQDAYAKSLVIAKVKNVKDREAERARQIADGTAPNKVDLSWLNDPTKHAPKTWDRPTADGEPPSVELFKDAAGKPQYLLVHAGNGVSCAAPAAWMLLDANLDIVDFGVGGSTQQLLDWDGDGAIDRVELSWHTGQAIAITHPDRPVLATFDLQPNVLSCHWEQLEPLWAPGVPKPDTRHRD